MTPPCHPMRLVTSMPPDAAAEIAAGMTVERDRYRAAMLWALGPGRFPSGEVLLRAALGELVPGSLRYPPTMGDVTPMLRLLRAMPWAREGFVVLGRDCETWTMVGASLCDVAGLPNPWVEIGR